MHEGNVEISPPPAVGVRKIDLLSVELFAPLSGDVTEANPGLTGQPELVNSEPYGEGWMIRIRVADTSQLAELLDPEAYDKLVAAG